MELCYGRVFQLWTRHGAVWFRVFGYGLSIQQYKYWRPLFSERYGYNKPWLKIGSWFRVFLLKPKGEC